MAYFEDESMFTHIKVCDTPKGRMRFEYLGKSEWWCDLKVGHAWQHTLTIAISSNLSTNISCAALYAEYLVQSKEAETV